MLTTPKHPTLRPQPGLPSWCLRFLLLVLLAAPAAAHELGVIQVYGTFQKGGSYQIDIHADEEHLKPGQAGGPARATRYGPIAGMTAPVAARFGRFLADLVDSATLSFDGRPVTSPPEVAIVPPDGGTLGAAGAATAAASRAGGSGRVILRLQGAIPAGVRTFTWGTALKLGSYPLVLRNEGDESAAWQWLEGGRTSPPFHLATRVVPPTRWEVVRLYLQLGYTHILPEGTDHILFVLGIFLLGRKLKPVLLQVTSFTIAHTITLALTIYGVVSLSPRIVEPLIALSIVYVAVENVLTPELRPSRIALVFGFGLLHGMGFAGVLREMGLPRSEFLPALVSFNLGVEAGQLTVITAAFLLLGLPLSRFSWYRKGVIVPASCLIGAIGLYWSIQRIFFA